MIKTIQADYQREIRRQARSAGRIEAFDEAISLLDKFAALERRDYSSLKAALRGKISAEKHK